MCSPHPLRLFKKKMDFQSGSRAVHIRAFTGFAPGCSCTLRTGCVFSFCTRVHDLCTLFAPGCRILLDILLQPIRHVGIVRFPGCFQGFISLPIVFITIEEFLPMAFIFVNGAAFQPVLVPVVILLSMTFPFIRLINDHLSVTSRFSRM